MTARYELRVIATGEVIEAPNAAALSEWVRAHDRTFHGVTNEPLREQIRGYVWRAMTNAVDEVDSVGGFDLPLSGDDIRDATEPYLSAAVTAIEALIDEAVKEHHNVGAMHGDCGIGAVARAWGRPCPVCPRPTDFFASLPAVDEFGVPVSKMPNCPNCGADELGMLTERHVLCYACRFEVTR